MTASELSEVKVNKAFRYENGIIYRKMKHGEKPMNILRPGKGYISLRLDGKTFLAHRILWVLVYGSLDTSVELDHIDGNTRNNTVENLRVVTHRTNTQNKPKNRAGHIPGTTFDKITKRWVTRIHIKGTTMHLGRFDTQQMAGEFYQLAVEFADKFENPIQYRQFLYEKLASRRF